MSFAVRIAQINDAASLADLGARSFAGAFAQQNTPEDMAAYLAEAFSNQKQTDELRTPGSWFLIAELDGQAVGYARLHQHAAPGCIRGENPIEIVRFYLLQDYIGRGHGQALMQACVDEAARRGGDSLWLSTWQENPRANQFYARAGFEIVGTQSFQLGRETQQDYVMERAIGGR